MTTTSSASPLSRNLSASSIGALSRNSIGALSRNKYDVRGATTREGRLLSLATTRRLMTPPIHIVGSLGPASHKLRRYCTPTSNRRLVDLAERAARDCVQERV